MLGIYCLIFTILVKTSVSHVIFPDVLQSALQNIRSKREESCGKSLDLEETGGVAEIQLRTELFNGTTFYRSFENCTWTLKSSKDHFMVLQSEYFSVEESVDCVLDYLMITENDLNGTQSRFCGWNPLKYITSTNEITLQFVSDVSFEDQGFKLIIETVKSCLDSVLAGEVPRIMNNDAIGENCIYRIQAQEDQVITLNLKMLNFGSASCEEERIVIYEGQNGETIDTICSNSVNGMLPYHASSIVIEYRNTIQKEGERFTLEYMIVQDNFTPSTVPTTIASPVGGNNDCSGVYKGIHTDDGVIVYTAPEYTDDKECVVVVRNERLRRHVVQIEFVYFDIENSTNCSFDSLTLISGERKDSFPLGGPYCGESLDGRTFRTRGNSLRFEFKTDESFALKGFQAKISFVPIKDCSCDDDNKICILQDYEKRCVQGQNCAGNICQNGGTCIRTDSTEMCHCLLGFHGDTCSQSDGELSYNIHFVKAPSSHTLERGDPRTEECQVEDPSGETIQYDWFFQGKLIEPYNKKTGFGSHPGGVLKIDNFSDDLEGRYSCFATTSTGTAEHNFEYRITESCDVKVLFGPQNEIKKIDEDVLLACRVNSQAKIVRWEKDNVELDYNNDTRIRKLSNNYLDINPIKMSDAGVYKCVAEDENGCLSYRKGTLQVLDLKPLGKYCGISTHDEAARDEKKEYSKISKGTEALPNEHPWHVTFRKTKPFCGGTLISRRFVVTAAHCSKEFDAENVELLLGTTVCFGSLSKGEIKKLRNYTIHPNYKNRATHDNDIALVELDSPVEYTDSVRPICLEPADYYDREFLENRKSSGPVAGKVAGCGYLRGGFSRQPDNLQEVHLPYVNTEKCEDSFSKKNRGSFTDTMFCAGKKVANKGDTCPGDSGGGLVMTTSTKWYLTGVVSWGIGRCDGAGHYGVYTNVGMYYDWIDQISKFSEEEVPDFLS